MKKLVSETKQQLWEQCDDICADVFEFYRGIIEKIEGHNAAVKAEYLFNGYIGGGFIKHPGLEHRCTLMLRFCVYPAKSADSCVPANAPCYYSEIGTAKRLKDGRYQLKINGREDKGLTFFLKRCAGQLEKSPAEAALKYRAGETALYALMPKRWGSFYKTSFFSPKAVLLFILFALVLMRSAADPQWHPSRYRYSRKSREDSKKKKKRINQ